MYIYTSKLSVNCYVYSTLYFYCIYEFRICENINKLQRNVDD